MTAINLMHIDDLNNKARFYKLDIQPSLFGGWSLVREWGRIGRAGRVCVEFYQTRGVADLALIAKRGGEAEEGLSITCARS